MKFVASIKYQNKEKIKALHPVHREYLRRFLEMSRCVLQARLLMMKAHCGFLKLRLPKRWKRS